MKTIVVLSNNYPSEQNPTRGVFVYNLIKEFSRDYKVVVISLLAFNLKNKGRQQKLAEDPAEKVVFPKHISFSNLVYRFPVLNKIKDKSTKTIIEKELGKIEDIYFVYAHFLGSALPAIDFAYKNKIPLFVALGESSVYPRYKYITNNKQTAVEIGKKLSGVIAVSEKLQKFATDTLSVSKKNILISPNATDSTIFYPFKIEREELSLPKDKFIISFVGSFIGRKGIGVILKAAERLPEVGFVLMGKGALPIKPQNILLSNTVSHQDIPKYLNASDAFVFPTKAEGSSNAIAEAMACGLAIITSNIPEVTYQVGKGNAIFINPTSVDELVEAIGQLKNDNNLKNKLSKSSLNVAKERTIENRAVTIINWIESKINNNENPLPY